MNTNIKESFAGWLSGFHRRKHIRFFYGMNHTLSDVDEIKVDVEFERHTGALEAVSMDETTQN